jgi:hypothetical protein
VVHSGILALLFQGVCAIVSCTPVYRSYIMMLLITEKSVAVVPYLAGRRNAWHSIAWQSNAYFLFTVIEVLNSSSENTGFRDFQGKRIITY